jgi:hypothetical protein
MYSPSRNISAGFSNKLASLSTIINPRGPVLSQVVMEIYVAPAPIKSR